MENETANRVVLVDQLPSPQHLFSALILSRRFDLGKLTMSLILDRQEMKCN